MTRAMRSKRPLNLSPVMIRRPRVTQVVASRLPREWRSPIGGALGPVSDTNDRAGMRVTATNDPTLPEMHTPEAPREGKTWDLVTIVGASKIMEMRIATC